MLLIAGPSIVLGMGDPPGTWPAFARSAERRAFSDSPLPSLASPLWTRAADESGLPIHFQYQAAPIVSPRCVFAVGSVAIPGQGTVWKLFAFDRTDGHVRWSASVPAPYLDSWSSPVLDPEHNAVIFPSGNFRAAGSFLTCLDAEDGHLRWQTPLPLSVVNASPLVTADLGNADRLFITDYGFNGGFGSSLHCVNIDPRHEPDNPYDPGQIVWSAPIGDSSGNSPAYLPALKGGVGLVYVCTASAFPGTPGSILAFDPATTSTPQPVFDSTAPGVSSFFAGLTISPPTQPGGDPSILAATYNFYGDLASSTLVKFNARTGEPVWSTPCNRTATIPVVLSDGRVLVSGGVESFNVNSGRSIALFADHGSSADLIWDSALATWIDAGVIGYMEPGEYVPYGGWTIQPVAAANGPIVVVGRGPAGSNSSDPAIDLFILDTSRSPTDPDFILDHSTLAGGSPAIVDGNVFSLGTAGLVAFGTPVPHFDVNQDGRESVDDLYNWEQGLGDRDCDRDGSVTPSDRLLLIGHLRANEPGSLTYEH